MIVLALNCGSSSVKCRVVDVERGTDRTVAEGTVEGVLDGEPMLTVRARAVVARQRLAARGHGAAAEHLLRALIGGERAQWVEAVGHRVVHGGEQFGPPVIVDERVRAALAALGNLAPLHNGPSLAGIDAARTVLGPGVPTVAVFDGAFHASLPDRARHYAIPAHLAERHGLRRFGFHGLSYESALERYCELSGTATARATLVALHLGSGCSAVAIKDGQSVDTSMGLTPLEGLVMGTRAGDLDPTIVGLLAKSEGVGVDVVDEWLNRRSGLLGLSGLSHDMRRLLAEEPHHRGARLAIEVFCYRARKYIGAYLAALGGAQAVVFTGAIGASSPEIRARICEGMQWCGLELDGERNAATVAREGRISSDRATVAGYAIPADEERVVARATARRLGERV